MLIFIGRQWALACAVALPWLHRQAKFMKMFKTHSCTFIHHMLLLLCFMGSKPVVYRQRFHHSLVSAWVTGWNMAVDDHKTNYSLKLQLHQTFLTVKCCMQFLLYLVIFGDYLSPLLVKFHRRILLSVRRWRANTREGGVKKRRGMSFKI